MKYYVEYIYSAIVLFHKYYIDFFKRVYYFNLTVELILNYNFFYTALYARYNSFNRQSIINFPLSSGLNFVLL